jgi:RNA 3'-terminal phosphate cyclase-like protein
MKILNHTLKPTTMTTTPSSRTLKFDDGSVQFRQRLVVSILSSRPLLLRNIRSEDIDSPGLQEHEASFLRLLDRMTNGSRIEINATGTQLRFKPGILLGGDIEHDCPVAATTQGSSDSSRGVGWYLEGILPLAPFGKAPLQLTLHGITNGYTTNGLDPSPDYLQSSFIPLFIKLGIGGSASGGSSSNDSIPPLIKVHKRGAAPLGGGTVSFYCPIIYNKELTPLDLLTFGKVKRIRGVAVSCRIPPSSAARVAHSTKGVLHRLLPDVWIHTDVHNNSSGGGSFGAGRKRKVGGGDSNETIGSSSSSSSGGGGCGPSPGLGIVLTATTTSGVCLSAECSMEHHHQQGSNTNNNNNNNTTSTSSMVVDRRKMELPEELGQRSAIAILNEIQAGGCVDTYAQSFILLMMCLTPEDVSRVRLGELSPYTIISLRLYKLAFGVEFKLRIDDTNNDDDDDNDSYRNIDNNSKTVICSCLGIGYRNMARAST